jgi:hypothetical protein
MDKLKNNAYYLFDELGKMFPDAKCELEFKNPFELLVSVSLSAQTTDKRVNIVTKELFYKYPDAFSLMNARDEDVLNIIKSIGLAKTKTKNIINLSKVLVEKFNGVVPKTIEEFRREGEMQHICVFSLRYFEFVIEHSSIIVFLRKEKDTPYVTIEYDYRNFEVVQARGKSNADVEPELYQYIVDLGKKLYHERLFHG